MCHPGEHRRHMEACGCGCVPSARYMEACGCGCVPSTHFRHFMSSKEKREMLEKYRDQLKNEIEGLNECIQELKGK